MNSRSKLLGAAALAAVTIGVGSMEGSAGSVTGKGEKQAATVLNNAAHFYAGLTSYQSQVRIVTHIKSPTRESDVIANYELAMRRPFDFALLFQRGFGGGDAVNSRAGATFYLPIANRRISEPQAQSLQELFAAKPFVRVSEGFFKQCGLDLLLAGSGNQEVAVKAAFDGQEKIDGRLCDRITADLPAGKSDLWFEHGPHPWLVKAQPTVIMSDSLKKLSEHGHLKISQSIQLLNSTAQDVDAALFNYKAPIEAIESKSFLTADNPPDQAMFKASGADETSLWSADEKRDRRKRAEDILRKVDEFYARAKVLSFRLVNGTNYFTPREAKRSYTVLDVVAERPNKLSIVEKYGSPTQDLVSDGSNVTIYDPLLNKYLVRKAGNSFNQLLVRSEFRPGFSSLKSSVLAPLLSETPGKALLPPDSEVFYVGSESLEGTQVDHLRFSAHGIKEDMYVESGANPWVKHVVVELNSPGHGGEPPEIAQFVSHYKNMTMDPPIRRETFSFAPAFAAAKVDSFAIRPKSPLVGQTAPEINLSLLDGGEFKLSSLKGNKTVVLDFWATWCPPCRRSLPLLVKVADAYRQKGVVYYAIDEREDTDTVKEFMQKNGYKFPVLLDKDGTAGEQYQVGGIPQTVIIDRQGIVRELHVGASPELDEELSAELDGILTSK